MPFFRQLTFKNCGVSVVTLLLFILTSCSGGEGGTNGGNNAGPGITTITASENCVGSTSARWSLRECGSRAYLGGVAWSGSLYVAVGWSYTDVGSDVLTSTDGITWTRRTTGKDSPYHLHRIAWGNGLFVAVGEQKELLTSRKWVRIYINRWFALDSRSERIRYFVDEHRMVRQSIRRCWICRQNFLIQRRHHLERPLPTDSIGVEQSDLGRQSVCGVWLARYDTRITGRYNMDRAPNQRS